MFSLASGTTSDTGTLQPVVQAAGWLVSAVGAIALGWRGRTHWEPAEEDLGRGAAKVSSLLTAVGLALFWVRLGSSKHEDALTILAAVFAGCCLVSLLGYGYLISSLVVEKMTATGVDQSTTSKIVGGFTLTSAAADLVRNRPELTIHEIFKGAAYDAEKIWKPKSRALAKGLLSLAYICLTMFGTLSIVCAAILVVVSR